MKQNEKRKNRLMGLLLALVFIILFQKHASILIQADKPVTAQNSEALTYTGTILSDLSIPLSNAVVNVGIPMSGKLHVLNSTKTNANGFYVLETPISFPNYILLIKYDNNETQGVDWIPVYYNIPKNRIHQNVTTILTPATTIILTGPHRSIFSTSPLVTYSIVDNFDEIILVNENPLQFGYTSDYTQFLGVNASTLIAPANVKFRVNSSFFEMPNRNEDEFIFAQGQVKHLDVRKYTLYSDTIRFEAYLENIDSLITEYRGRGYYGQWEYSHYESAVNLYNISQDYYSKGEYENSFNTLKLAYINLQNIETDIKDNINEAQSSIFPSLLYFTLASYSLSNLFSGKESKRILIFGLTTILFYFLFVLVFPGKDIISVTDLIFYGVISSISVLGVIGLLKVAFKKGHKNRLGLFDVLAVSVVFGVNNLKRRWLRSVLVFTTVLVISMSFISLTSFSVTYGIIQENVGQTTSSLSGVMVRMQEYVSPYSVDDPFYSTDVGQYIPVDDLSASWLLSNVGVKGISRIAESQPIHNIPIVGFNPSTEPLMESIDNVTVIGDKLRQGGTCLIHADRLGRAEKGNVIQVGVHPNVLSLEVYDIGDEVQGLEIVGGFNDSIGDICDLDGSSILPKYRRWNNDEGQYFVRLFNPLEVIVTSVDDALELGCNVSRAYLLVEGKLDIDLLVKNLVLSSNFRLWTSESGNVIQTSLGNMVSNEGGFLFLPYVIVVLTVVSTILGSFFERRKEINVLSSVGLNPGHISAIFLSESSILGFSAGSVGYLFGMGMYQLMGSLPYAPNVSQKLSSIWIVATLGLSISSVLIGTLIALRHSISLTPSLKRKWSIWDEEKPEDLDHWQVELPVRVDERQLNNFINNIESTLRKNIQSQTQASRSLMLGIQYVNVKKEFAKDRHLIRFFHRLDENNYSRNDIVLEKAEDEYFIKLHTIGHEASADHVGRLVRKIIMNWSIASTSRYTHAPK